MSLLKNHYTLTILDQKIALSKNPLLIGKIGKHLITILNLGLVHAPPFQNHSGSKSFYYAGAFLTIVPNYALKINYFPRISTYLASHLLQSVLLSSPILFLLSSDQHIFLLNHLLAALLLYMATFYHSLFQKL